MLVPTGEFVTGLHIPPNRPPLLAQSRHNLVPICSCLTQPSSLLLTGLPVVPVTDPVYVGHNARTSFCATEYYRRVLPGFPVPGTGLTYISFNPAPGLCRRATEPSCRLPASLSVPATESTYPGDNVQLNVGLQTPLAAY